MNIKEYIKEQRLITDGAMGTYYEEKYSEDTVIAEKENLKNPEQIKEIHLEYLRAGARLIRTNTFAANTMFLADMQEVKETVRAGYEIAKGSSNRISGRKWKRDSGIYRSRFRTDL